MDSPSIMNSLTISHSCFMCVSERYLQFFAASSHSSGPAFGFNLAGPGWGTLSAMLRVDTSKGLSECDHSRQTQE